MHLERTGLEQLVAIKASMNFGLSEHLKNAFPNIRAAKRANIIIGKIEPQWMAGFASGEGCFFINIKKKKSTTRTRTNITLSFSLAQQIRDETLMRRCIEFFQAGMLFKQGNCYRLDIYKFGDLFTKVLPIFNEYPIMGIKAQDYKDWSEVLYLMARKEHLRAEGIEEIRNIKEGMNKGRAWKTEKIAE